MMYSIKKFAEMIGVTTKTLRNWDKNDLLKPIILPSGHRRYTDEHLKIIQEEKWTKKSLKK